MLNRGSFAYWAEQAKVAKRIADIMNAYDFSDDKGLVTCLGSHQDNHLATVYFTNLALEGEGMELAGSVWFEPTEVERDMLGIKGFYFRQSTDDNGFHYGESRDRPHFEWAKREQEQIDAELETEQA